MGLKQARGVGSVTERYFSQNDLTMLIIFQYFVEFIFLNKTTLVIFSPKLLSRGCSTCYHGLKINLLIIKWLSGVMHQIYMGKYGGDSLG